MPGSTGSLLVGSCCGLITWCLIEGLGAVGLEATSSDLVSLLRDVDSGF